MFDSHAHYYDKKFNALPGGADALLEKLFESGEVEKIINVATNPENTELCVKMAARYPGMYVAAGIHPEDCEAYPDTDAALAALYERISPEKVRRRDKIVAIGEIGLDYYWKPHDKKKQADFFDAQMAFAADWGFQSSSTTARRTGTALRPCSGIRRCAACSTATAEARKWRGS